MSKHTVNSILLQFFILCIFAVGSSKADVNCSDYETNIVLYGFKDSINNMFISTLDQSLEDFGCGPKDNVSIIVHGWLEGLNTTVWVNTTIVNLLKHRHGCLFFFDYSQYSKNNDYGRLVTHYEKIAAVLTKYLLHIGNPERIFMFGFSFGSRLTVEAGIASFNGSIDRIELCDPAGPGFDGSQRAKVPTLAGKSVACIRTSTNYGTHAYNCHQNFRMGQCGQQQSAHGNYPKGSHGLCPYFWNQAFEYDFIPYNYYGCNSNQLANLTEGVKMGFLGNFNRTEVRGDIFISTAAREPYIAVPTKDVVRTMNELSHFVRTFAERQYQRRDDKGDATMYKLRRDIKNSTAITLGYLDTFIAQLLASYPPEFQSNGNHET